MAAVSPTSLDHPADGPRQTKRQSPMGVSTEHTSPPQPTPAASVQQLTQKTTTVA